MNVMIFAAGLGTRLKPFTDRHPKALAPVGGIPALERNLNSIKQIKSADIGRVVINIHHFPRQIRDYIASNDFGLPIEFSDESDLLLDTGGGLLKAIPLLSQNSSGARSNAPGALGSDDLILLLNADILTDLPFDEIIAAHLDSDADVTLLCANRESSRTLWFDAENRLVGWENLKTGKTKPAGFASNKQGLSQSPFCGVHILKASKVLPLLAEYAKSQESPAFPIIPFYLSEIDNLKINRFLLPDQYHWFDIGSPSKLAAANSFFNS